MVLGNSIFYLLKRDYQHLLLYKWCLHGVSVLAHGFVNHEGGVDRNGHESSRA